MLDVDYVTFKQTLLVMWINMEMGISGGRIYKEQGEVGQWQPNKLQSKGDHRRLENSNAKHPTIFFISLKYLQISVLNGSFIKFRWISLIGYL